MDKLFPMNSQHWKQPGVDDAMLDLLVAFIRSILVSILYLKELKKKKTGFIFSCTIINTKYQINHNR